MGSATGEPRRALRDPASSHVVYTDDEGQTTDDPAAAVRGEITEYDDHGRLRRRTRFFLAERDLPWLPVSELAFLIWVLAALVVVWLVIGLVLQVT